MPEDQNRSNLSTTISTPPTSSTTTPGQQRPSSDQSGASSKIPRPVSKIPTPAVKADISADLTSSAAQPPLSQDGGPTTVDVSKTEPPKSPTSPRSRGSRIPRPTAISTTTSAVGRITSPKEEGSITTESEDKTEIKLGKSKGTGVY